MFFDLDAYERFRMSKEERALYDEQKKEEKKEEDKKVDKKVKVKFDLIKSKKAKDNKDDKGTAVKPLQTRPGQLPRPRDAAHRELVKHGRRHPEQRR